jgi:hypothetical protein
MGGLFGGGQSSPPPVILPAPSPPPPPHAPKAEDNSAVQAAIERERNAAAMAKGPRWPNPMFFKFAKGHCCNYSQVGPNGKSHYCWQEGCTCMLHPSVDMGCFYFVNAVLPLNKELEAKWLALQKPWKTSPLDPAQPKPASVRVLYRVCKCGQRFAPASNRQRLCPECGRTNRTEKARLRKRRQRASN